MTDRGHPDPLDGVPGPGLAGDPGAGRGPEVVDLDRLEHVAARPAAEVVDFSDLAPDPIPDAGSRPEDVADAASEVLAPSEVDVAELDDRTSGPSAEPEVVDPGALRATGGRRPARDRTARDRPSRRPVSDEDGEAPAPPERRSSSSARRSSFGDDGSRPMGGRSKGGAGRKQKPRREWGIQLDAEVDEPQPTTGAPTADGGASALPDRRPAGRARTGLSGRPRRRDDEPAPQYEDPERTAKDLCLTALTGTSRSRKQLADLLADRGIPDDVAEGVLDRFEEVGLVDDAAFAAAWVRSRQSARGLSRRALAHELRGKGVDPEVATVALEAVDPQDEWDTARALVARKVPGMRRLDSATATRRLTAMLARKGYGSGLAGWVVREALEADGKAEDAAAEADDAPPETAGAAPTVRRGLWSGRPLDEPDGSPQVEVGEGLSAEGWARTRRPGSRLR